MISLCIFMMPHHFQLIGKLTDLVLLHGTTLLKEQDTMKGCLEQIKLTHCINRSHELLETKDYRRSKAETCIRAMANQSNLELSLVKGSNNACVWASNGSMRPATSDLFEDKTITTAITGPKTLVMRI